MCIQVTIQAAQIQNICRAIQSKSRYYSSQHNDNTANSGRPPKHNLECKWDPILRNRIGQSFKLKVGIQHDGPAYKNMSNCKSVPVLMNSSRPNIWNKNWPNSTDLHLHKYLKSKWFQFWGTDRPEHLNRKSESNQASLNLHKHFKVKWVPILRNGSGLNSWIES